MKTVDNGRFVQCFTNCSRLTEIEKISYKTALHLCTLMPKVHKRPSSKQAGYVRSQHSPIRAIKVVAKLNRACHDVWSCLESPCGCWKINSNRTIYTSLSILHQNGAIQWDFNTIKKLKWQKGVKLRICATKTRSEKVVRWKWIRRAVEIFSLFLHKLTNVGNCGNSFECHLQHQEMTEEIN